MESFSRMGCKNCENVRKTAKICVFHNRYPKKKTLRKPCKNLAKSLDFCNISQNSLVFALPFAGVNAPLWRVEQQLWKICEMRCFSRVFRGTFARRFCCEMYISQIYFALFFNFRNYSQLLFSQIPAMHTLMRREDMDRKWSFGRSASAALREMTWRPNSPEHRQADVSYGLPRFLCR